MSPRYVLVFFNDWEGTRWGRVVAHGSEKAVEAARRLLVPLNGVDCAVEQPPTGKWRAP